MIIKTIIRLTLLTLTATQFLNADMSKKCDGKKIVSQSPYITHSIDFFDMKECIIGATVYDNQVARNLPRTGKVFVPDKSAIEKLNPDFIFSSDWTKPQTMAEITPLNAKWFILHGFASMTQVENNLYTIGNVLHVKDFQAKVKEFSAKWRELAHSVDAKNKKVLLLSACSQDPYSYGKKTYLGELFMEAGFDVVEQSERVKLFKITNERSELDEFIEEFKPDFIFGFVPYSKASTCAVLDTNKKLPIVYLDGDLFLHPAPVIIDGLKELKSKEGEW